MFKVIKKELEFEEGLKKKIEFICEFAKVKPIFINGSIRKIDKTNYNRQLKNKINYDNIYINNNGEIFMEKEKHSKKFIISVSVILVILLLLIGFTFFSANIKNLIYHITKKGVEEIKDSCVMLKIYDKEGELISTGSGFCYCQNNYILTNYHVIEGAYKIGAVTDDNKEYEVNNILIFNGKNDLAILSGDIDLKPIQINENPNLEAGKQISTIGSPKGELNTVSTGVISNADDDYQIRITAPISPGSSGGVLLNEYNQAIGVTYATYDSEDSQNINYAINIKYANELLKNYQDHQYEKFNNEIYDKLYYSLRLKNLDLLSLGQGTEEDKQNYTVESIDVFYTVTNPRARFEYALSNIQDNWKILYESMYSSLKNKTIEIAKDIFDSQENTLASIERESGIARKLDDMTADELFIRLKVMDKYKLAIMLGDLSQFESSSEKVSRVSTYDLTEEQKLFTYCFVCGYNWYELSSSQKEALFDYICSLMSDLDNIKAILNKLGYDTEIIGNKIYGYW